MAILAAIAAVPAFSAEDAAPKSPTDAIREAIPVQVTVEYGTVFFSGIHPDEFVEVTDPDGDIIYNGPAEEMTIDQPGAYTLRIRNSDYKVVL
ncbi:MAG: hypothetical protein NC187_00905 [Candidatus Amulumruptor caecigallinarius]|nr:hypothetical protein [Candidatus Amulumruptor caecigallinarius]MCM1396035.1 hypothetical protein [Candidatus Amulumruptor caecigallinarius]MCM1453034.1 hypothetical protein [bacterium]